MRAGARSPFAHGGSGPEQRLELSGVRVLVDAPEGTVVNCRWTATVGKEPRQLTGEFSLTVGPATLSVDGIEVDQQVNGDEDDH
jgi:hypothetical protein